MSYTLQCWQSRACPRRGNVINVNNVNSILVQRRRLCNVDNVDDVNVKEYPRCIQNNINSTLFKHCRHCNVDVFDIVDVNGNTDDLNSISIQHRRRCDVNNVDDVNGKEMSTMLTMLNRYRINIVSSLCWRCRKRNMYSTSDVRQKVTRKVQLSSQIRRAKKYAHLIFWEYVSE